MVRVSIILPTFNEEEAIVPLLKKVSAVLQKTGYSYELIVVDDQSVDRTAQRVQAYANSQVKGRVRLLVRTQNHGLALSIKAGIENARGEVIIGMDADGNHPPQTIPLLLEKLKDNQLVVASRFVQGGGMQNQLRAIPTRIMNQFFQLLGMPLTDNTSGYYAIRAADLRALNLDRIYYGYGDYHLRLVAFAHSARYSSAEVPTSYGERLGGVSKSKLLQMLVNYTREVMHLKMQGYLDAQKRTATK